MTLLHDKIDDLQITRNLTVKKNAAVTIESGVIMAGLEVPVMFLDAPAGGKVNQTIFLASRAYRVSRISAVHSVAEATAPSHNANITKDADTDAPGAGSALLTDNSDLGFAFEAVANTLQVGTLVADEATLTLAAGDRLGIDYNVAGTEVAGVAVTVLLTPI